MLESHSKQIDIIDTTAMKQVRKKMKKKKKKKKKKKIRGANPESRLAMAINEITLRWGGGGGGGKGGGRGELQLVCGRPTLVLCSALVPQTLSRSVCVEDS